MQLLATIAIALAAMPAAVMAGTPADTAAIVTGTVLTAGLYVPIKMVGIIARCRKSDNQNQAMCEKQAGCEWESDDKQCRAAGVTGWRDYYADKNRYCGQYLEKKACKAVEACYWGGWGKDTCKARVLNAFRKTFSSTTDEFPQEKPVAPKVNVDVVTPPKDPQVTVQAPVVVIAPSPASGGAVSTST